MQPNFYTHHDYQPISLLASAEFVATPPARLYDFSGLGQLSQDAAFVREMQQLFVERVPVQLAELQRTIEAEDWETIAQRAHSLKSTFGNLRIEPSTGLLNEMESLAFQHRDKLELAALLKVVATTADTVVRIFRQELSRAA
jgi:two-component system aerobic respiration control sensor histidine kinase ArcB